MAKTCQQVVKEAALTVCALSFPVIRACRSASLMVSVQSAFLSTKEQEHFDQKNK